ncbi:MAG: ribosome maturation factor RimP [Gammaproteobacteria bacterium]
MAAGPGGEQGMSKTRAQLIALLEPSIEALGYELVDLELIFGGRRGVLRLFIDKLVPADLMAGASEPGDAGDGPRVDGIGMEDCEAVSRQVSALLDVEDPIGRDYDLEVSSPGLDRKLVKPAHFDRFAGCAVQGRFCRMMDGRRRFSGTLLARNGPMVTMRVGNSNLTVALEDLEVVRLVPEY